MRIANVAPSGNLNKVQNISFWHDLDCAAKVAPFPKMKNMSLHVLQQNINCTPQCNLEQTTLLVAHGAIVTKKLSFESQAIQIISNFQKTYMFGWTHSRDSPWWPPYCITSDNCNSNRYGKKQSHCDGPGIQHYESHTNTQFVICVWPNIYLNFMSKTSIAERRDPMR